jgi:hypothetical protein
MTSDDRRTTLTMDDSTRMTARSGVDPFRAGTTALSFTLGDFWRWAASDLLSNALRGVVAEFLVAKACGCDDRCRVEWDACDLTTPSGLKLEIKTSGYVQSWAQARLSVPTFDIAVKRSWDAASNTYAPVPGRPADIYVFALHAHQDRSSADPMDVAQWQFFVLRAAVLGERCATQKRIGLTALRALEPRVTAFERLADAIETEGAAAGSRDLL